MPSTTIAASELSERAQRLLKALVESYAREGQPVGSRALARASGLQVSAATVRNVMADLEEMGLVSSPHTSAGRVPTDKGYRVFVDSLLTVQPLDSDEVADLKRQLAPETNPADVLAKASVALSGITQMAAVVTLPQRDCFPLRHVEFLPLSGNRVLAIFVINQSEVQNRVIHTDRAWSPSELEQAANYLNAHFAGRDLQEIRRRLLTELRETKARMDSLLQAAIEMAERAFETDDQQPDYVVSGQTNLMGFQELSDVDKLRRLFDTFTEKQELLSLMDACVGADGVQIFIGEESGYQALDTCSVVTSSYQTGGHILGALGVIGPTRMVYERVIPLVDVTAKLLGAALKDR